MKNNKKLALAAATFGIAALAMGGSTFAWFQVANTANVAIEGNVIGVDNNLDIGFKTTTEILTATDLGLVEDEDYAGAGFLYWAPQSVNAAIMDAVITASGYTSGNELTPITTGAFDLDSLEASEKVIAPFHARPEFNANRTDKEVSLTELDDAEMKAAAVGFTVVFRTMTQETVEAAVADVPIYFSDTTIVTASTGVEALRFGYSTTYDATTYTNIINPSAALDGSTAVGGAIDLNGDGARDYTFPTYVGGVLQPQYEIAYGEFDEALATADDWALAATEATDVVPLVPVIPTPFSNEDFLAGGNAIGVNAFISDTKAKLANYTTFDAYEYVDGSTDTPLTVTDADGLAEVEIMMWLEGWDAAVVNSMAEAVLGSALAFEAPTLY